MRDEYTRTETYRIDPTNADVIRPGEWNALYLEDFKRPEDCTREELVAFAYRAAPLLERCAELEQEIQELSFR